MDPLPRPPRTFLEIIEADLRRAARGIIKVQDELDPQFRVATPEGDYHLAVTMPPTEARATLRKVGTFLAWKQAIAVTMATELVEPDCVICIGITADTALGCLSRITREPRPWTSASFGPVEWLPASALDGDVLDALRSCRSTDPNGGW